jgi:hypothetical protein
LKRRGIAVFLFSWLIVTSAAAQIDRDRDEPLTTRIVRFVKHLLPPFFATPNDDYPGPPRP